MSAAKKPIAKRIAFRIEREVVLDVIWFDQGWYDEMLSDGKRPDEALRLMVEAAVEEDALSVLWEAFGPGLEFPTEFAKSLTNLRLVRTVGGTGTEIAA